MKKPFLIFCVVFVLAVSVFAAEEIHDGVTQGGASSGTDVTLDATATAGGLTLDGQEISFQEASRSTAGYLSAAYFGIFADGGGDTHDAVTLNATATTAGLSLSGQELSYRAATTDQSGYLTSADWNTFNNKQGAQNEVTLNSSASLGGMSISDQEISFQESSRSQAGYLSAAYFQDFADKEDSDSNNIDPDRLAGDATDDNKVDHSIVLPPGTDGQLIYNNAGALAGTSTIGISFANGTTSDADAVGEPFWDTNGDNSTITDGVFVIYGAAAKYHFSMDAYPTSDAQVPAYSAASHKLVWAAAGSGDVTKVGNCDSGDCLDGTSDGGTQILFYDAQGATTLVGGDTSGAVTLTLPVATGTLLTSGGLSSSVYGQKEIGWTVVNATTATAVADGLQGAAIPASMNGMNLIDVTCSCSDLNSASGGATTVVLRRVRAGTPQDMTSTGVTIDYNAYTASDETVNTSYDDVATGDMIYVDINGVTTGAAQKGLSCTAIFQTP